MRAASAVKAALASAPWKRREKQIEIAASKRKIRRLTRPNPASRWRSGGDPAGEAKGSARASPPIALLLRSARIVEHHLDQRRADDVRCAAALVCEHNHAEFVLDKTGKAVITAGLTVVPE